MTDQGQTSSEDLKQGKQDSLVKMAVLAQYVKDLSFETPNPAYTLKQEQIKNSHLKVDFNLEFKMLKKGVFELVLKVSLRAGDKRDDTVFYLAELAYAGVFAVKEEVSQMRVMVEGAHLMFPFIRMILINLSVSAGFAPLILNPIDFADLYRRRHEFQFSSGKANGKS